MKKRREFLKASMKWITGIGVLIHPLFSAIRSVYAKMNKMVLPKDTERESLKSRDPADLDTRNLELTPLKDFETMGTTDHVVNMNKWRLEITGLVQNPLKLTYEQIMALPSIERDVLMICPGVFSNHGRWKGVSMKALLNQAGIKKEATHINFKGPDIQYEKTARYPIEDVLAGTVFLAYGVNGKTLPQKHGFPLRVVADDTYGSDWVKYVYGLEVEIA